jgi:hypothetical protein
VPVLNLLPGVAGGIFMGGRLAAEGATREHTRVYATRTATLVTGILAIACTASAFLALRDPSTAANLEGMLKLRFSITPVMLVALILGGGAVLLLLQWWLARGATRLTHAFLQSGDPIATA